MSELELPEICGVMMLKDCTLFPHGGMPLRIYEPRYRRMLEEALEGRCFFSLARLTAKETDESPAMFTDPIGTIGLVRASRQMDDGTSHLLLHGVVRVRFVSWMNETEYPMARIRPVPSLFEPANQAEAALESLREAAEQAIEPLEDEVGAAFRAMTESIDDPAILADVMSQQFIHEPDQRHQLLTMETVAERVAWLCQYLR